MPYLDKPFKHDVFISYGHGDFDGDGASPLKQWSLQFAEKLRRDICQVRLFRDFDLFIDQSRHPDQSLDPTEPLVKQLEKVVETSALLLVIMSPDYLESEWCKKERHWWLDHNEEGPFEPMGRIFICRSMPNVTGLDWDAHLDDADWPDEFKQGLVGFWFHSRSDVDFGTKPFFWDGSSSDLDDYNAAMLELVRTVTRRLHDLKQRQEDMAQEIVAHDRLGGGSPVIYLHARDHQQRIWAEVRDTLVGKGFPVFPDRPELLTNGTVLDAKQVRNARNQRIQVMSDCDAVVLLGTEDNPELAHDLLAIGHRDRQTARDLTNRPLPCAVLNQAGRPISVANDFAIHDLDGRAKNWADELATWLTTVSQHASA